MDAGDHHRQPHRQVFVGLDRIGPGGQAVGLEGDDGDVPVGGEGGEVGLRLLAEQLDVRRAGRLPSGAPP